MEEFRKLFSIANNADEESIEKTFSEIANILLQKCVIKRDDVQYRIEEIEFYFFNKNHRDIIAYPRNTSSLQWYRNAFFGLDITFESHISVTSIDNEECYFIDDSSAYGGVLIRTISKDGKLIKGPRNCANELFDVLNATSQPVNYPLLCVADERQIEINQNSRINIAKKTDSVSLEERVKSILWNNWYANEYIEDMKRDFEYFINKPYRFTTSNI